MENNKPSLDLTEKFIKGLQNYGLTYDEILNSNWRYCGGRSGRHLNYFKLCCKDDDLPDPVNECVCGHIIKENCYITDGKQLLVLGNCCIKKFIPNSSRTCEKCGEPHKNRVVNRCENCRIGVCDVCGKNCDEMYKKCYKCTYKN
jgi:hypothetical protein